MPDRSTPTAMPSPTSASASSVSRSRACSSRRAVGVEHRVAAPEPDLRQPRALAHQHRKGLGTDLGVERAVVAGADAVEAAGLVGDHAREHVEPSGRTFRIGGGGNVVRQRQAFDQRHDVDAAGLQHRAVGERDLVQLQFVDALGDRGARSRQETGAHAVGHVAQAQVEARRLNLVRRNRRREGSAPRASAAIMWSGRMPLVAGVGATVPLGQRHHRSTRRVS